MLDASPPLATALAAHPLANAPLVLTDKAVGALFGKSRSWVWRAVKAGELPKPVRVAGSTFWRASEIAAHVEKLEHAA
jgi:predicted DNA-binding transcriptional regulator AlpA